MQRAVGCGRSKKEPGAAAAAHGVLPAQRRTLGVPEAAHAPRNCCGVGLGGSCDGGNSGIPAAQIFLVMRGEFFVSSVSMERSFSPGMENIVPRKGMSFSV